MGAGLRRLALAGFVVGGAWAVIAWRRGRRAGEAPFDRLRLVMNERVDPWLMRRGFTGGAHSEIGVIEHIGRKSGVAHETPVYPRFDGDRVWIPLPYGQASQWARNVIAAGHCELHVHRAVYGLDEPLIVPASENPNLPRLVARLADWLHIEYLRLHRFAEQPEETITAAPGAPLEAPEAEPVQTAASAVA